MQKEKWGKNCPISHRLDIVFLELWGICSNSFTVSSYKDDL